MSTQDVEKNWSEIKTKIMTKWNKITDADTDLFKDDLHAIAAKIEKIYGVTKLEAEKQVGEFTRSVQALVGAPIAKAATEVKKAATL